MDEKTTIVLQTSWLDDALVSDLSTHNAPATLTLDAGQVSVTTFPFDENTIRFKYRNYPSNSGPKTNITIKITDTFRQFIKNCVIIFEEITITLGNNNEIILSAMSSMQALKYRFQIDTTEGFCIPRNDSLETTLRIHWVTFITSWKLFDSKMVTLSICKGNKTLKMHSEITESSKVDLVTIIECNSEATSDNCYTYNFASGRIFQFLHCENEWVSLSFLPNGLLALDSEGVTVFVAPEQID